MPVNKDAAGNRSVQAEVEVPGTPEEVWEAIATGRGISSWFVPSKVDERVAGRVTSNFGPGMEAVATVTTWDPPRRFVAMGDDELGPDGPRVATEWIVEARAGGTCVVRVVHSWFTSKDDWDGQFEGHSYGWAAFFRVLRFYLTHFRGQPGVMLQAMGAAPEPKSQAWDAFTSALGVKDVKVGQRVKSAVGAPPLSGVVEWVGAEAWPELIIKLDEPAPGLAHLAPHAMGGPVMLSARYYLYGAQSAVAAPRAEGEWQAWVAQHFPMPAM